MDRTVYRPGAGKSPPLMVGRDEIIRSWERMLDEVRVDGRGAAQDLLLTGPRGVGKTCALTAIADRARRGDYEVINLQAVKKRPTLITSLMRQADSAVADDRGAWGRAKAAFERFAGAELGVGGVVNFGVSLHGRADGASATHDPESLALALAQLAHATREASPGGRTGGVMLTLDELQVGDAAELALIAATLQRLNVDHPDEPVVFASTGLPHTMQVLKDAGVTHPERLFVETRIPLQLGVTDARAAIVEPARDLGVIWDPHAVDAVLEASNRYPAHLQFFAQEVWREATGRTVEPRDAQVAIPRGADQLSMRSLDPRWDEMAPREAELVTAIAAHGGRATVRDLEATLGRNQQSWSRTRQSLIEAGDIYAPRRGELEIAVPALARYALHHYPELLAESTTSLVPLEAMPAGNTEVEQVAPAPVEPGGSLGRRVRRAPRELPPGGGGAQPPGPRR